VTVWVVICEESQEERARRARRERRALREAVFVGLIAYRGFYLFGESGKSVSDPALLRFCARFPSKAAAEAALGANRDDDGYLYHFVELTADHAALLDLAEVE